MEIFSSRVLLFLLFTVVSISDSRKNGDGGKIGVLDSGLLVRRRSVPEARGTLGTVNVTIDVSNRNGEEEETDEIIRKAEVLRKREVVGGSSNNLDVGSREGSGEIRKEHNVFEERRTEDALNSVLARPLRSYVEDETRKPTEETSPCSPLFPHNEGPGPDPCHTDVEKHLAMLRRKRAGTGATGLETTEPRGFVRAETWKLTPESFSSALDISSSEDFGPT